MAIIEAVLFNNELELLEARLHEGDRHVDRWVVIESSETFTGMEKPLHFADNKSMFGPFLDRIDHIVVPPAHGSATPWEREAYQRDSAVEALWGLADDDLFVLSDADELTSRSMWPKILKATEDGTSVSLHKPTWYYTLHWALPDSGPDVSSFRSKACRVWSLWERLSNSTIADWASDTSFTHVVYHSGWHLSCLGGPAKLLEKIQSFSHQEINIEGWATYENCQRLIQQGIDCVPTRNLPLTRTPIPAGPQWLVNEGVTKYPWLLTGEDSNASNRTRVCRKSCKNAQDEHSGDEGPDCRGSGRQRICGTIF